LNSAADKTKEGAQAAIQKAKVTGSQAKAEVEAGAKKLTN
jgi:hypothetical protein